MDATAPATVARIKTIDVLPFSTSRRNPTQTASLSSCNRAFSIRFSKNPNPRRSVLYVTRCSTKPDVGSDSVRNKKSTAIELNSNSTAHPPTTQHTSQPLPSTCSRGLVLGLGPEDCFDSAGIGSPVVKRYIGDDEERWYMWYHGRSDGENASDSIGLAVSSNGVHWARGVENVRSCGDVGSVMGCSKNWWSFDTESVRPSELVLMSSTMYSAVYWLYYTGYSSEEVEIPESAKILFENPDQKMFKSLPGLACSQDGRHWARIEGDHHSGALLDVGSGNEWDSLFIGTPRVVVHSSDDLRMYYHSFDVENGKFAIGLARSRDGIRWVKMGKIMGGGAKGSFDEFGVTNACVIKNEKDGKYLMAYEGVDANGVRSIGFAVSKDGLKKWERVQENAGFKGSEDDAWDDKGVGSPSLIQMEGKTAEWRLYYRGISKVGKSGIGLAISEGSDFRSFKRWEGIQL